MSEDRPGQNPCPKRAEFTEMQQRITRALYAAGRDALIRHKREGQPIIVWRDGKSVSIPAEQIEIPPAEPR